jgi:hypothetical protein
MDYKLAIIQKPTYLHAIVTGENTKENVEKYLEDLYGECITRKCFRILIEEQLEGPRIDTLDVFSIVKRGSSRIFGIFKAIAYVDTKAVGSLMHFAETVGRNRGLPVAVFSSIAEAENWLLKNESHHNGA